MTIQSIYKGGFAFGLLILFLHSALAANVCFDENNLCVLDTAINIDTNFVDENTYLLISDIDVTGAGVDLNIEPGTVIKFMGGVDLSASNGARILANGTADRNIIFTSCKDQNVYAGSTNRNTSTEAGCDGGLLVPDYNTAIWIKADAGTTRLDEFSFLKIIDANIGIRFDRNAGDVHDNNFFIIDACGTAASQRAIALHFVNLAVNDVNVYNNAFTGLGGAIFSTYGYGIYCLSGNFTGSVHHNTFLNGFHGDAIYTYNCDFNAAIYSNRFTNFLSATSGIDGWVGGVYGGSIFRNVFEIFNNSKAIYFMSDPRGAVYENIFRDFSNGADGIFLISSEDGFPFIYDNNFSNFSSGDGVEMQQTYTGRIHGNRFTGFNSSKGISATTSSFMNADIFNNYFSNFVDSSVGLRATIGELSGNVFNNEFTDFGNSDAFQSTAGGTVSAQIYNNRIRDFNSVGSDAFQNDAIFSGAFYNNTLSNVPSGFKNTLTSTGRIQRNIFSNVTTAFTDASVTTIASHNAFFNVASIGGIAQMHENDQNADTGFISDPFIADGSDRNFLLNAVSAGGEKLVDSGGADSNSVDVNNFFNLRTTRLNNKLDTQTIDLGYHFDQNAPFVVVVSPSDSNTLQGVQSIDFNVESGYGAAGGLTARLAYATTAQTSPSGGTQIISQAVSDYTCSAGPVFSCSFAWDTTAVLDGNYFISLAGTDLNGVSVDNSDQNFRVQQDLAAPVTSLDYNVSWQGVDANIVFSCVDAFGCTLTQYRLDSLDSNAVSMGPWQTFDSNVLITEDGNWAIDFNSSDDAGNHETTRRVYILIDRNGPIIEVLSPVNGSSSSTGNLNLSYSATDLFSGIKRFFVSTDGSTWIDNALNETYSFLGLSAGSHWLYVRGTDQADNNSDVNVSVTVLAASSGSMDRGASWITCGYYVARGQAEICTVSEYCTGIWLDVIDSNRCCEQTCVAISQSPLTEPTPNNPDVLGSNVPMDLCEKKICDDQNPCTNDYCWRGECYAQPFHSGECGQATCVGADCFYSSNGLQGILPAKDDSLFGLGVLILRWVLSFLRGLSGL